MCFQFDSTTIANRVFGKRERDSLQAQEKSTLRKAKRIMSGTAAQSVGRTVLQVRLNQAFTVENLGEAGLAVVRVFT